MPSNGIVAGSALNLNIQGSVPTLPLQVSFPVDLGDLGYPTNALPPTPPPRSPWCKPTRR